MSKYKLETKLVHLGRNPNKYAGMVNTPIFKSSTIIYPNIEEFLKNDTPVHTHLTYARSGTPTVHALENTLAELDKADHCIVTASGLSAIMLALMSFLKSGDHVLITDMCYKCTKRSVEEEFTRLGIEFTFYEATDAKALVKLIKPNTKVIYMESPSSRTFEVQDIAELCKIAEEHSLITILDNTWATPIYFQPFKYGVDIVVQSLTKYINGHSDLILGAISFNKKHSERLIQAFRNYGNIPSPDHCYQVLRGLRTLKLRIDYQFASALKVADFLEKHSKIKKVLYPPLPSFETHDIWQRDFKGATGVFGIVIKTTPTSQINKFFNTLKLFAIGLSWGGFESLIMPYSINDMKNKARTYKGYYVRLNIGLENNEDLIKDLDNALKYI